MNRFFIGLALAFSLSGCVVADKLAEPGPSAALAAGKASGQTTDESCELKNPSGSGRCEDGRGGDADDEVSPEEAAKLDACISDGSSRMRPFHELIEKERYGAAFDTCMQIMAGSRVAAVPAPTPEPEPAGTFESAVSDGGSVPQDGTWYCDNLSGSGQYGTWEMTQHPEMFDVSSCYRVD